MLSDYVLRTRLGLREAGWHECEELIWLKPDAPPLGSLKRPRRTWEIDPLVQQVCSALLRFEGLRQGVGPAWLRGVSRFGFGGDSPINLGQSAGCTSGVARISDVIVANVGVNEPGLDHPAVFPLGLAEQLIKTFSQAGDLVLDNFCGSGQTLLAAKGCGRRYLGIEREAKYVRIALGRLIP